MATRKKSATMQHLESMIGEALSLANLIEAIRLSEEESQVHFAKRLGISRSHVCDIEKGRKSISVVRAAAFAQILGYSQEQFIRLALQDEINRAGLKGLKVSVDAA